MQSFALYLRTDSVHPHKKPPSPSALARDHKIYKVDHQTSNMVDELE